jgi:hypothetical protein
MARTTRGAALLVLLLSLAACATGGAVGGGGGRFPRYVEPIRQIAQIRGRLGWGGFSVGMTLKDAERALGKRLPIFETARDEMCGRHIVEVELRRQKLGLEFEGTGEEARLAALWLLLWNPAGGGEMTTLEIVRALKARFPDLQYVPSPHGAQPESVNPKPLYRLAEDALFFVDPATGVYFGKVCVD